MSDHTPASADLPPIQGNVLAPFAKDHQTFLIFRLPDNVSDGKKWLGAMAHEVASHVEVAAFNELFKLVNSRRQGERGVVEATWTQLLLSGHGLTRLGIPAEEIAAVSPALAAGMKARAAGLGDQQESDPANWLSPFGQEDVDAVVVVAADEAEDMLEQVERLERLADHHHLQMIWHHVGATLGGRLRGHEHFGFKDGISQPPVDDPSMLGRFLLGRSPSDPPLPWSPPANLPAWATGASLAVLRMLYQDVAAFRDWVTAQAPASGLEAPHLAAKLVGRWPSGAPLDKAPTQDDPAIAADPSQRNAFDFADDPNGERTPRFAHIRKVNPRAESPGPTNGATESMQRSMLRRGIPFGPALPPDTTTDDKKQRGLFFLAFVANIEAQFEFVQQSWCNEPNFPAGPTPATGSTYQPQPGDPADGPDPVVGQHHGQGQDNLRSAGTVHSLPLQQFVRTLGGEYLISLSIPALEQLGR
jgi:Dyp-type peroxidase family